MQGIITFYKQGKGFGWLRPFDKKEKDVFFHISNVVGELLELLDVKKYEGEPITFETRASTMKPDTLEAINIRLDLTSRAVGYVVEFGKGYGWISEVPSNTRYFFHVSSIRGSDRKFIGLEIGDPVVFTRSENDKGRVAEDVVKVDTRNQLETFAGFDDFNESVGDLQGKAEQEPWDYIKNRTLKSPVLYSYINYTFERAQQQGKLIQGHSSEGSEYAYFNTGLVTPFQDEIYGYFRKSHSIETPGQWHIARPEYEFLEFETDQSHYRKYFSETPEIATYFSEAEVRQLVFDTSLNQGKIIVDRDHLLTRKNRFPSKIAGLDDESFFDAIAKSIELAIKRIKRNYKTAIPHFYDGKIQFLLPLCMITKKDADLALVVNQEESVYKAHTVLTLDQAYNNARLLAKPDREWLNP